MPPVWSCKKALEAGRLILLLSLIMVPVMIVPGGKTTGMPAYILRRALNVVNAKDGAEINKAISKAGKVFFIVVNFSVAIVSWFSKYRKNNIHVR